MAMQDFYTAHPRETEIGLVTWICFDVGDDATAAYRLTVKEGGDGVVDEVRVFRGPRRERFARIGLYEPGDGGAARLAPPGLPVPARLLRDIPMAHHVALIHDDYAPGLTDSSGFNFLAAAGLIDFLLGGGRKEYGTDRRTRRPDLLLAVAILYAAAIRSGERRPVRAVEAGLKAHHGYFAEGVTKNLIREAREAGLLTETLPGVASGRLTVRAVRALLAMGVISRDDLRRRRSHPL